MIRLTRTLLQRTLGLDGSARQMSPVERCGRGALRSIAVLLIFVTTSAWAHFDHAPWDTLLKRDVVMLDRGTASRVRYAELRKERAQLQRYLRSLSAVSEAEFRQWNKAEQLAFLVNAYNAFTVDLVLTRYPDMKSIKDLGSAFASPWKRSFFSLLGATRSLDDLEHGLIRAEGGYEDPRIHFALVCAAAGCPALRNEAYRSERLDQQLDDAALKFMSNRSRNRYNGMTGQLEVSKIFDWYGRDFARGWKGYTSVAQFLAKYSSALTDEIAGQHRIAAGQARIVYLDYDWKLNDASSFEESN